MAFVRALALLALSSWLLLHCVCSGRPFGSGRGTAEAAAGARWSESVSNGNLCRLCVDTLKYLQSAFGSNATLDDVLPYLLKICDTAVTGNGAYMCPGILNSYGPVVQYVLTHTFIEPQEFCQTLHLCNQTTEEDARSQEPMLRGVEKLVSKAREDETRRRRQRTAEKPSNSPLRILQLADIHLDTMYSVGSPSDCGLYMCCRSWYNGTDPAGYYGEFQCDLPMQTLELLVEAIQQIDPQPDFVIYTGDNPPHDIWNNTWTTQMEGTRRIVDYLAEKLPSLTIYPAIGNHESYPESEYFLTKSEYQMLNVFLAGEWQKWVDLSDDALRNISRGSYYWVEPEEGLRIISINTDHWYNMNFYAFLNEDNHYFFEQIQWIEEQLAAAKAAGKKVIIIGHIPPKVGNSFSSYGEFYLSISKRYSDTIVTSIFGHTHNDEFKVVLDSDGVYGSVMIAPSVTPYGRMNPSFRIYSLDRSDGYRLMDYEQYHLNLTKANELAGKGVKPQFEFSYSPAKLYDLPDLSPDSWAGLAGRFELFNSLVSDYRYNFHGKTRESDRICNDICTKEVLCDILNIVSIDFLKCLAT